ncbi:MAG TPA: hypothetical protein VLZ81_10620, partial [Blastocatellia bacterium]|nr:hypothetical protein [Blastocatellia bacterium]
NTADSPLEHDFTEIIFSNLVSQSKPTDGASSPANQELSETAAKEIEGTYQNPNISVKIAEVKGKTSLVVPGQPAYPLMQKGPSTLVSPLLPASYSVEIKRDGAGKVSAITIKQPGLNLDLTRSVDYAAPISVDELVTKAIQAFGGEANLRKHSSRLVTASLNLVNQGMTGEATTMSRAPNSLSERLTFEALGRKVGWQHNYFDGAAGGSRSSFTPPQPLKTHDVELAKATDDFHNLLDLRTVFKQIAVTGTDKVDGEDAYVLSMTTASGDMATEYYSTKTFLLLRRDPPQRSGQKSSEYYSDYRPVDGEMVPFKIVQETPAEGGQIVVQIKDVKFNVPMADAEFRP